MPGAVRSSARRRTPSGRRSAGPPGGARRAPTSRARPRRGRADGRSRRPGAWRLPPTFRRCSIRVMKLWYSAGVCSTARAQRRSALSWASRIRVWGSAMPGAPLWAGSRGSLGSVPRHRRAGRGRIVSVGQLTSTGSGIQAIGGSGGIVGYVRASHRRTPRRVRQRARAPRIAERGMTGSRCPSSQANSTRPQPGRKWTSRSGQLPARAADSRGRTGCGGSRARLPAPRIRPRAPRGPPPRPDRPRDTRPGGSRPASPGRRPAPGARPRPRSSTGPSCALPWVSSFRETEAGPHATAPR